MWLVIISSAGGASAAGAVQAGASFEESYKDETL